MRTKWLFFLSCGLVALGMVLTAWKLLERPHTYRGSLIDPPVKAADFSLQDQHGQRFKLSEQAGKISLIFFGYTHCPDVCPITLARFTQIKESLAEHARGVNFVMVTTDPEKDSAAVMMNFLSRFDPQFIGLTGSRAELVPVWEKYGVYQAREADGHADDYLVAHTSRVYLIDQEGNWRLTYPYEMDAEAIVNDLSFLLRQH